MGGSGGGSYINAPIQISVDGGNSTSVLDDLITRFTENKNKLEQIGKDIDKSISPSLKSAATSAKTLFESLTGLNNLSFTTTIANLTSLEGKLASVQSQALRTAESLARTGAVPINNSIIVPPGSSRGTSPSVTPGLARGSLYIQDARGRFRDVRGRFATPPVLFEPSQSPINTPTSGRAYGRDLRNPQEVAIALAYRQARDAGQLTPELQIDLAQKFAQARWPRLAGLPSSVGIGQLPGTANAQYDPGTRSIMMRPGGTGDFNPFRTLPHELRHAFDYQRPAGFANSLKKQYGTWWEDKEIEAAGRSVIESRGSRAGSVGENAFRRAVTASTNLNRNDLRQIFTNPEMLKEFTGATSDFTGAPALFEKAGTGPIASARRMRPPKGIIPSVIQPNPEYIFMGREAIEALTPAKLRKPRPGQLNRAVWQQRIEDTNNQVYDVTTDIEYGLQQNARGRWEKQEKRRKEIVQRLEQDEKTGLYRKARVQGSTLVEKPTVYQFAQGPGQLTDYLVSDIEKRGGGRTRKYVSTDPSGKTFQTKLKDTVFAGGAERPLSTTTRTLDPAANLWKTKKEIDATTKAMIDGEKKSDGYHGSLKRHMRYMIEGTLLYATFGAAIYGVMGAFTQAVTAASTYESSIARIGFITEKSKGQLIGLNEIIQTTSKRGIAPTQLIGAFEEITQATKDETEQFSLLDNASKLAIMGNMSMEKSTDRLITILRQNNMALTDGKQILDVLAAGYQQGKISIEEFTEAMAEGSIVAESLGMSWKNYSALIVGTSESINVSADRIRTMWTMIGQRIFQPNMARQFYEATNIGVFADEEGTERRPILSIVEELRNKRQSGAFSESQFKSALEILGSTRYYNELRAVIENFDKISESMSRLENASGAADALLGKQMDTWKYKTDQLGSAWERFLLSLANTNAAKGIVDGLNSSLSETASRLQKINEIGLFESFKGTITQTPVLEQYKQKRQSLYDEATALSEGIGRMEGVRYMWKDQEAYNKQVESMKRQQKEKMDQAAGISATLQAFGWEPKSKSFNMREEDDVQIQPKGTTSDFAKHPGTGFPAPNYQLAGMMESSAADVNNIINKYFELLPQYKDTIGKWFPDTATMAIPYSQGLMTVPNVNQAIWGLAQSKTKKEQENQLEKRRDWTPDAWQRFPGLVQSYQSMLEQYRPDLAKEENQRQFYYFDKMNQNLVSIRASNEAIQWAEEELNTLMNKRLEGTYNIPSTYQAWMPQNWAPGYYAATGNTKTGPVNYPSATGNTSQDAILTDLLYRGQQQTVDQVPKIPLGSLTPSSPLQMSVAQSINTASDLTKSPESTTYLDAISRNTGLMVQQLGAIEGALNGIDIKIANILGRMMDSRGGGMSNGGVNSSGTLGNTSGSPYSGGW